MGRLKRFAEASRVAAAEVTLTKKQDAEVLWVCRVVGWVTGGAALFGVLFLVGLLPLSALSKTALVLAGASGALVFGWTVMSIMASLMLISIHRDGFPEREVE